jgi:uncharacterized protein (TIGR02246 family)
MRRRAGAAHRAGMTTNRQQQRPRVIARTPEETHAVLEAAFNAGDLEAFVDVHEDHAVTIVPPRGVRVRGRDAIRRSLAETFALRPRVSIDVIEKLESEGLALTLARWTLEGMDGDGTPVRMAGRGTIVSRRQPDGTWRILLDIPARPDAGVDGAEAATLHAERRGVSRTRLVVMTASARPGETGRAPGRDLRRIPAHVEGGSR